MPNAEATAAITAAVTRRSEARTSPLPRQAPRRRAIGFGVFVGGINASPLRGACLSPCDKLWLRLVRHRKAKRACHQQRGAAEKQKAQPQRPIQISTPLFGNSSGFSAPGGKYRASCSPHNSTAATKPSPGRPSLIAEIIAATALDHTSGVTLALIPLSATISA